MDSLACIMYKVHNKRLIRTELNNFASHTWNYCHYFQASQCKYVKQFFKACWVCLQTILLHSHGFDSNFPRSSYSFSKCLMSSNYIPGIVLGSWDTTVNKIDKAPILKELAFWRGRRNHFYYHVLYLRKEREMTEFKTCKGRVIESKYIE